MAASALIGVLGGMEPLATVDFLHKIVEETPAATDQEHVPVVCWNVPQIPDRQHALAGRGPSPLPAMLQGIVRLAAAGATRIVVPCNTAHCWFDELQAASPVPLIHIVDASLAALLVGEDDERVGLIASRGTLESGLYQRRLDSAGIPWLANSDAEIEELFVPGCYAVKRNALHEGALLLARAAERLVERGANRLILACTEVPLALRRIDSPLLGISIDTNQALAGACVDYWLAASRHAARQVA
ncbi:MAG: aspartate racemase [Candidatus Dactylopiibacterium carminicum]|uniref:aspartate/glutamate racemase family protein n=1 Tax=Candidatus Dactylopiibacterium carminicum TaxID=857335 RepID=UPI000BCAADC2|nr:amino acid racemase [Candidatus Dactylopiibacterium carminicum]PAS96339.1 MAG: aspartate racemase [Candidatus Dactylopiibacterium carminicum]